MHSYNAWRTLCLCVLVMTAPLVQITSLMPGYGHCNEAIFCSLKETNSVMWMCYQGLWSFPEPRGLALTEIKVDPCCCISTAREARRDVKTRYCHRHAATVLNSLPIRQPWELWHLASVASLLFWANGAVKRDWTVKRMVQGRRSHLWISILVRWNVTWK